MTSYLSRLSPIPAFPPYTGPYTVGTVDIELPVSDLDAPSASPDEFIHTVQYRIFYPCDSEFKGKHISWIQSPQREVLAAYTRFLGAGNVLSEFISYFPRMLHYITIPALKNAPLLKPPTSTSRWPVMLFSHGLGGSRNAYSQIIGSIASHGMIVICPEHRDGSTPISFIRPVPPSTSSPQTNSEKSSWLGSSSSSKKYARKINYIRVSHTPTPDVEEARNAQLRIRLWELGLIFSSLHTLDTSPGTLRNLNPSTASLETFKDKMDIHRPGTVVFAGHSFGATTMTQLIKSTFYAPQNSTAPASYTPLFVPSARSRIAGQVGRETPVVLLDVWCLPLRAESTRWLWDLPFPCYSPSPSSDSNSPSPLLAILSQAFHAWPTHLAHTKALLSPSPSSPKPFPYEEKGVKRPHFFYVKHSAHLSQSDFGVLFPWVGRRWLGVREPEGVVRLNVRAVVRVLRRVGNELARFGEPVSSSLSSSKSSSGLGSEPRSGEGEEEDKDILSQEQGKVRDWCWVSTDDTETPDDDEEVAESERSERIEPSESSSSENGAETVLGKELLRDGDGVEV